MTVAVIGSQNCMSKRRTVQGYKGYVCDLGGSATHIVASLEWGCAVVWFLVVESLEWLGLALCPFPE